MVQARRKLAILLLSVTAMSLFPVSASHSMQEISRHFLNTTFTYRQFACSEREQECFRENKLLYEADGECHSVGGQGPCAQGEIFHADKAEAQRKGGHLRGTCHKPCPGVDHAPLAATGECMTRRQVQEKICRADLYLRPAMDVFGQWVCDWTTLLCKRDAQSFVSSFNPYKTYDGLCSPPPIFNTLIDGGENATVPDEKPVDHPLLQYFENNTILEREFPCTEEEKACLQYGRVLHSDGICYSPNQWSSRCEPGQTFHLDLNEAVKANGRLRGTCRTPCKNYKQQHIITQQCVDYSEMTNICRWEWGMQVKNDNFGRIGCSCGWYSGKPEQPPPSIPPPASTPGHCTAPDFSNPVQSPIYDRTLEIGFSLQCSEEEFTCLKEGKVLLNASCHSLRTRGPCAQGKEVVLDKEALVHARLQPKCAPSPCPEGSVLMRIDGKCLTHQQVKSLLCPGLHVVLDEFGGWQCNFQENYWPGNLTTVHRHSADGTCEMPEKFGAPVAIGFGGRPGTPAGAAAPSGPVGGFGAGSRPNTGFQG